jgi:hypothetical protein
MPPLTGRIYDRSRLERTPGHPLACPPGGVHIGLLGHRRFPKRPETLIASPAQDHLRIVGSNPWPQPAHPQGLLTFCNVSSTRTLRGLAGAPTTTAGNAPA